MFKDMRRKDRQIETEAAVEVLKNGEYGVLSTVGENGYAYGVPLSYTYSDNKIYFHCAKEGTKLNNIRFNNKVSFCVIGKTEVLPCKFSTNYESVIVFGDAFEVEGEEKTKGLMDVIKKYSAGFIPEGEKYLHASAHETVVVRIDIKHLTGKARR